MEPAKKRSGQRGPDKTPRAVTADRKGIGGAPKKAEKDKLVQLRFSLKRSDYEKIIRRYGDEKAALMAALALPE